MKNENSNILKPDIVMTILMFCKYVLTIFVSKAEMSVVVLNKSHLSALFRGSFF